MSDTMSHTMLGAKSGAKLDAKSDASTIQIRCRDNVLRDVDISSISRRLRAINSRPWQLQCNPAFVTESVLHEIRPGMAMREVYELAARTADSKWRHHPHYQMLSARIMIDDYHRQLVKQHRINTFSDCVSALYHNRDVRGRDAPRVNRKLYEFVTHHAPALNSMVDYNADFRFSYIGYANMMEKYLLKRSGTTEDVQRRPQDYACERAQDMFMRVACALFMNRSDITSTAPLARINAMYRMLSVGAIMASTPILYNAGTLSENMISCFIIACHDSISGRGGIAEMMKSIMEISKKSGGIGMRMDLRHAGSEIRSINGMSDGLRQFLRIPELLLQIINQGGKRPGSGADNLTPLHPFFLEWTKLPLDGGLPKLFYAAMLPDLFMNLVKTDGLLYQFNPIDYPQIYTEVRYTTEGSNLQAIYDYGVTTRAYHGPPVRARELWESMLETIQKKGRPYVIFQCAANRKNNQQNIGTVYATNLCTEIMEVSSPEEYACCVVSTICLPSFVRVEGAGVTRRVSYDWDGMSRAVRMQIHALTRVIMENDYPAAEYTKAANQRLRPLALGVQGEADVYAMYRIPFVSAEATELCFQIYEALHYHAWDESCLMAEHAGRPYEGFEGSPASRGIFQWQMWGVDESRLRLDWKGLRARVMRHGLFHSLLTSLPPTATTSYLQGYNECFEPFRSMVKLRKVLGGEYPQLNQYLTEHLIEDGLWTDDVANSVATSGGSVQAIEAIPERIRRIYRTWGEYKTADIIDMQVTRGQFIDQSCSNNQFIVDPTVKKLHHMLFYGWRRGLKTGMYYLEQPSKSDQIAFGNSGGAIAKKIGIDSSVAAPVAVATSVATKCVWRRRGEPVPAGCESCSA